MKKLILFLFLCLTVFISTRHLTRDQSQLNALLNYNIEALAGDSERPGIGRCYGYGSVDCPVSHDKVEYLMAGYSLEVGN